MIGESIDESVSRLFARGATLVSNFATGRVGADRASDVVSETFLVIWQKRAALPTDDRHQILWMMAIARFTALREIDRRRRRRLDYPTSLSAVELNVEATVDDIADIVVRRDAGMTTLEGLSARQRTVLEVAMTNDGSPSAGARRLGITTTAYTTRLHRLRQQLCADNFLGTT